MALDSSLIISSFALITSAIGTMYQVSARARPVMVIDEYYSIKSHETYIGNYV